MVMINDGFRFSPGSVNFPPKPDIVFVAPEQLTGTSASYQFWNLAELDELYPNMHSGLRDVIVAALRNDCHGTISVRPIDIAGDS